MSESSRELRFSVSENAGEGTALLRRPADARWLLVFAHGAGAGMRHTFMEAVVARLAAREIATFRYQFPYMERGRRGPSPRGTLLATVRAAVAAAQKEADGLTLVAGGKSMGGRMTSLAHSERALPGVKQLIFFGFPLHATGRPGAERGAHLIDVDLPMLFLQGTRDKLASLELLAPLCDELGARATLHVAEGADHSFHVLKRSGRSDEDVLDEICDASHAFLSKIGI